MLIDLVDDVLIEILARLDNTSLKNTFRSCQGLARFSTDPRLWQTKIVDEYGPEYLSDRSSFETFRDEYLNLKNHVFKCPWKALRAGHLYILRALKEDKNINYTFKFANNAARWGHLSILNWFEQQGILPDQWGADLAAEHNHLPVLIWLQSRNIFPTQHGLQQTCFKGHLDVLKWMIDELKMKPNLVSARMAAEGGHLKILKYFERMNIPMSNCINRALKNGNLEVVEWLLQRKHWPKVSMINKICGKDRLNLLLILASFGLYPNKEGIDTAVETGQVKVVKWLLGMGILPTEHYTPNTALEKRHFEILKMLVETGFRPTQRVIDHQYTDSRAIDFEEHKSEFVLLLSMKLLPSPNAVRWIKACGRTSFLNFLSSTSKFIS